MTMKRVCLLLLLAIGVLITGSIGLVVAGIGYALLALPILVNEWRHRAYLNSLTSEDIEDHGCSSEEFGPEADWVGGTLKWLPLFALLPAYSLRDDLARLRHGKRGTHA